MKKAIGIFDSGVGGLTVYKAIRDAFPEEDLIYFGDTARVPYGPKSPNTIIEYSIQNSRFLLQQGIKTLVVACNTSSAVAIPSLKQLTDIPIIGVIDPGAEQASRTSQSRRIGIIGTEGTVRSGAYTKAIQNHIPDAQVFSKACPLFVPIVEEGWQDHEVAYMIATDYLTELKEKEIDTLVLGCTHYPLLRNTIQQVMGDSVTLVDSAEAITQYLSCLLPPDTDGQLGKDSFFVSDNEDKFYKIAQTILHNSFESLARVRLFESWFKD